MSLFRSWRRMIETPVCNDAGAPLHGSDGRQLVEWVEAERWSTPFTVEWLRKNGGELMRTACRDGWHINLIDFVQHKNRLPNSRQCEALVIDFQNIEKATKGGPKRAAIQAKRAEIKAQLLAPQVKEAAE